MYSWMFVNYIHYISHYPSFTSTKNHGSKKTQIQDLAGHVLCNWHVSWTTMTMTMTMGPQGDDGRNVLDFYTCRGVFFEENETKGRLIFFGFRK